MSELTTSAWPSAGQSVGQWFASHWFLSFVFIYGLWILLPWLAPILMYVGWSGAGRAIYFIYSLFCHQLPERSFFLFGQQSMYSLVEIQAVWQNTANALILRQFIGSATMGWKVAWSDRMISFYGSIWLFGIVWWFLCRKFKALPWWAFVLLLLPMAVDGGSHLISDFAGLGQGFRDSNRWLAAMTDNSPPLTYAGDALGSFNSWMRLLTGFLAGFGIAWFAFPHLEASLAEE
jgi:uncharacterized membrane protein